jgi:hypothetical protein
MTETHTIIPYWFLMRAAGHLTPQDCEGHAYNGTCPKCRAQEILTLAAMRIGYIGTLPCTV